MSNIFYLFWKMYEKELKNENNNICPQVNLNYLLIITSLRGFKFFNIIAKLY